MYRAPLKVCVLNFQTFLGLYETRFSDAGKNKHFWYGNRCCNYWRGWL